MNSLEQPDRTEPELKPGGAADRPGARLAVGPRTAAIAILVLAGGALFAIRVLAGLDWSEGRLSAYVLDVLRNGNWICQHRFDGDLAGKPPLLHWLAALAVWLTGGVSSSAIFLPTAAATIGVALTIRGTSAPRFGWQAGFLAALAYILSPLANHQIAFERYDGLFSLTVALGAAAAYRAWESGRGWWLFWLVSAASTLTKGPLGVVLSAGGLLAAVWERRSGTPHPLRGRHAGGIAAFLVLTLGWLGLAYLVEGGEVIHRLFFEEILGRAVGESGRHWSDLYQPSSWYVLEFAPWSIVALLGFWRVIRSPAPEPEIRRFERFLLCWFVVGLIAFSLGGHQRTRLIYPVVPPAACIAGRELARRLGALRPAGVLGAGIGASILFLGIIAGYQGLTAGESVADRERVQRFARTIERRVGREFPFVYTECKFALQSFLGTMRTKVSAAEAAELLRRPEAVFVIVEDLPALASEFGSSPPPFRVLLEELGPDGLGIRLVSNQPALEWSERMAAKFNGLSIRTAGMRLEDVRWHDLSLRRLNPGGRAEIENEYGRPCLVRLDIRQESGAVEQDEKLLGAGETLAIGK